MTLKKASLVIAAVWLLATGNLAHASYLCTVDCVYAGAVVVVGSNEVDAIIMGNPLADVLGDPVSPPDTNPDTNLGVVLAKRVGGSFATPTVNSTLTVQMASGISSGGSLWIIGDEQVPGTLNETFRVFVSATGDFSGSGDSVEVGGPYNNNAFIDLSAYALPTTLNYIKLQASPTSILDPGPNPVPMAVLGIAGQSLPSAVPVPAAVWLFGSGLLGLLGIARRRQP